MDLSTLGHAIHGLINASYALDYQTAADLKKLHKLLPSPPAHPPHHDHPHHDCPKKQIKMFMLRVCSAMGSSKCARKLNKHSPDQDHGHGHGPHPGPPRLPKKKVAEIKKVLEDIRAGNKKRQAFEGGFISEKGIKVCSRCRVRWPNLTNRNESGISIKSLLLVYGSGTELPPSLPSLKVSLKSNEWERELMYSFDDRQVYRIGSKGGRRAGRDD